MRELTFGLVFEKGYDPLMDVFREHPELRARSDACVWNDGAYWRIDVATGPGPALEALDEVFVKETTCNDCLTPRSHIENVTYERFSPTTTRHIYYTYWEERGVCKAIPKLAMRYLGTGTLLRSIRDGAEHWWSITMLPDEEVGLFYDTLQAALPQEIQYRVGHLKDLEQWTGKSWSEITLPVKQDIAVETGIELGYYRTPRDASQSDIADELGVPRSTVSYRLRRAEGTMARAYVDREQVGYRNSSRNSCKQLYLADYLDSLSPRG